MGDHKNISNAIDILKSNLSQTVSVYEWAILMGYNCPKKFARNFIRYYAVRPQTYLKYIRLKSISQDLRKSEQSNFEIARKYGVMDEIALNKYINYHLNCSPTAIKVMKEKRVREKIEKFGCKINVSMR